MSMFHELMMRKKEEIMYATIKGTLTENDGVFSGFGGGNYLQIQNIINIGTKDFVIATKIKANSINNTRIIANYGTSYSGIHISSNKIAGSFYINGTRVQINNDITFTTNTDYYVIMYRKGTTIGISVSTDTVNWTTNEQTIQSTDEVNFGFNNLDIGVNRYGATFFDGSIDLNNSYIKLGSTKYNLQAVVGYTVVGSPTITDGVVSGFSSANYLQIAQSFPSVSSINKVKEQVVFTTGTIGTQQMIMGGDYGAGTFGFELRTNGKIMFRVTYTDANNTTRYAEVQCDTTLEQNTKYKAIGKFELSSLSLEFELYNENNVLLDKKTYTIQSSSFGALLNVGNYYLGRHWQRGVFTGSIYLNNTDIVINNKLWFNGQQA